MAREFKTDIGLEFYSDGELSFSFDGNYYAFYQLEYDNLVIRSTNDNLTIFRHEQASSILLDGVAFTNIQNQLNSIFENLKNSGGSPAIGYSLEVTQELIRDDIEEIKEANEAAANTLSGPLSPTTTSVQVLNPVGCKGFKIYNNTNGIVYIRIGTGTLVRSGATANYTFILGIGDYYESQPYERDLPISYAADAVLSGQLHITQFFKNP